MRRRRRPRCGRGTSRAVNSRSTRTRRRWRSTGGAAGTQRVPLGSVDPTGQGAVRLLQTLSKGIDHNRLLKTTVGFRGTYPVRYKRGQLTVTLGTADARSLWTEVSGLRVAFYEKPDSLLPISEMALRGSTVEFVHAPDEKLEHRIVINAEGGNAKSRVVLTGPGLCGTKATNLRQRLEWALAVRENSERLRHDGHRLPSMEAFRFKRMYAKTATGRVWIELDEMSLRVFSGPKAPRASSVLVLPQIKDVSQTATAFTVIMHSGESVVLAVDRFVSEWRHALVHNMEAFGDAFCPPKTTNAVASAVDAAPAAADVPASAPASAPAAIPSSSTEFRGSEIGVEECKMQNKLGDGCFGEVYRGVCRGKDVAIKVPLVQELDESQLETLRKEIDLMSANPHPNIVLFMGACTQPGNFRIVTELLDGDLDSLIKHSKEQFSLYQRLVMMRDAVQGMCWLHHCTPQIIHRDLKSANLLYERKGSQFRVKVCDFGLSAMKPQLASLKDQGGAKGTPLYMAPEVMLQEEFDEKADVYSFGIVLWEMLSRQDPYPHHSDYQTFVLAVVEDNERPAIPAGTPKNLVSLIERCWHPYPEGRPTFDEVLVELEQLIIEAALTDRDARRFWAQAFPRTYLVSWERFVPALSKFTGTDVAALHPRALECFETLLAMGREKEVDITRFEKLIRWFGPLLPPPDQSLLANIHAVVTQPWFHGDLTSQQAAASLTKEGPGAYLVRFSTQDGAFTLAGVNAKGDVGNMRIVRDHRGFLLDDEHIYPSLQDAVSALAGPLSYTKPCHGSPYAFLSSTAPAASAPMYGTVSGLM